MLGCDAALDLMDTVLRRGDASNAGFARRPALEAVSRGGLHAYRYAARHPDRIACIYADTPVMDLKSWPLGWPGAARKWPTPCRYYGFKDEAALRAYRGNPVDSCSNPSREAKIPLRHVISLNDRVVPPEQNTLEAQRRLQQLGHAMDVVTVAEGTAESNGHHFPLPEVVCVGAVHHAAHRPCCPEGRSTSRCATGWATAARSSSSEKTGRVAFLGGSITFNPGWRDAVMRYLQQRFPATKFDFIAAGIPSLGSVPACVPAGARRAVPRPGGSGVRRGGGERPQLRRPAECRGVALRGMEGVVRHVRAGESAAPTSSRCTSSTTSTSRPGAKAKCRTPSPRTSEWRSATAVRR